MTSCIYVQCWEATLACIKQAGHQAVHKDLSHGWAEITDYFAHGGSDFALSRSAQIMLHSVQVNPEYAQFFKVH